jgi:hypothetical protein
MFNTEIKIAEEDFNNCPGRTQIVRDITQSGVNVNVVDVEGMSSWENDPATLVLQVNGERAAALEVGKLAVGWNADEFDYMTREGNMVVRLWWD